jgi:hypothetical protein
VPHLARNVGEMDRHYIVEDVDSLQDPLGAFAVERATRTFSVVTTVPVPPLPAVPRRRRRWVVRTAIVVTVVALAGVVVVKFARMQRALARATAVADISERSLNEAEQRIRELTIRNTGRVVPADTASPTSALVFPLAKVRGNRSDISRNRVKLSGEATWVILVATLEAPPVSNLYRSTIDTRDGQRVWSNDRLSASQADTFAVGLSSRLLSVGEYVMTLEEQAVTSDAWMPVGRYIFRVVPQDLTGAR